MVVIQILTQYSFIIHFAQDIVTLQNPFNYLTRDSDWEGMSDGFDNGTAYGERRACLSSLMLMLPQNRRVTSRTI